MTEYAQPYSPTLRERLIAALQNAVGGSANTRGSASDFADNANRVIDAATALPFVGRIEPAEQAYRSAKSGDYRGATNNLAMAVLGAAPGEGAVEGEAGRALAAAGRYKPLQGLPQKALKVGGSDYIPGPLAKAKDAAASYMEQAGLPYNPPQTYTKINKDFGGRVAQAFDQMQHAPDDPAVKAAYEALARETKAQWQHVKATGLKVEPIPAGAPDPYAETPRLAAKDVRDNNHLWYFPSEQGFGSGPEAEAAMRNNPMLAPSGEKIGGKEVPYNRPRLRQHLALHGLRAAARGEDRPGTRHHAPAGAVRLHSGEGTPLGGGRRSLRAKWSDEPSRIRSVTHSGKLSMKSSSVIRHSGTLAVTIHSLPSQSADMSNTGASYANRVPYHKILWMSTGIDWAVCQAALH